LASIMAVLLGWPLAKSLRGVAMFMERRIPQSLQHIVQAYLQARSDRPEELATELLDKSSSNDQKSAYQNRSPFLPKELTLEIQAPVMLLQLPQGSHS